MSAAELPPPLLELLGHEDADQVRQGVELSLSLGLETALAAGCQVSERGDIRVGALIRRHVRPPFRLDVALRLLAARGALVSAQQLRIRDPAARSLSPAALAPLAGCVQMVSLEALNREDLTDISVIAQMRRLRRLDLSGGKELRSLTPLRGLPHLEELRLLWCAALGDLSPLASLPTLRKLSITLPAERALPALPELVSLSLTTRAEGALSLSGLPALRELSVSHSRGLRALSLADLPALETVTLYGCWGLSSVTLGPSVRALRAVDCAKLDLRPLQAEIDRRTQVS